MNKLKQKPRFKILLVILILFPIKSENPPGTEKQDPSLEMIQG